MADSRDVRDSVLQAIGNTPVVRLRKVVTPAMGELLVKLEYYNPTGSYKDRMALAMIEGAEKRGELRPGMRVVEWTGGSTGSSLAMVCAIKGYRFTPISSDGFSDEKLRTMRLFGADLEIFPAEGRQASAGALPADEKTRGRIGAGARDVLREPIQQHGCVARVHGNREGTYGASGHRSDGVLRRSGYRGNADGVSRALKAAGCKARIVALEPVSSAVLTTGKGGAHRVEGIAAGFRPPHLKDGDFDEVRTVEEGAAREMARRLAREEGIFAGTSSGLNVAAALQLAQELGPGSTVATVAVDTGFKYLAGDLYRE